MNVIMGYIMSNYTWFLIVIILILLAIIGRYADKTNFGQGNKKNDEQLDSKKDLINLENKRLEDCVAVKSLPEQNTNNLNNNQQDSKSLNELNSINAKNIDVNLLNSLNSLNLSNKKLEESQKKVAFETEKNSIDQQEELNEEIELLLPEKELIDDELLSDIEDLTLDKTQKINLGDIPSLDDVELPKIKQLKSLDEDIWNV